MHRVRTEHKAQVRAVRLRAEMTDAEKKLWRHLRGRQLDARQFRKQVPIGNYVVDFCCLKAQLVVEVDGGQHDAQAAQDEHRTRWLNGQGYRVIRFWNNEVLQNIDGVLQEISRVLALPPLRGVTDPHPNPPPNRGRG
jgi:adenine-specific DNA-methyltransferase